MLKYDCWFRFRFKVALQMFRGVSRGEEVGLPCQLPLSKERGL